MKKEILEEAKQTLHNTDHNKFKDFSVSKKETLEEVAEIFTQIWFQNNAFTKELFIEGVKWQQERSYSEEDMQLMFEFGYRNNNFIESTFKDALNYIKQKKK